MFLHPFVLVLDNRALQRRMRTSRFTAHLSAEATVFLVLLLGQRNHSASASSRCERGHDELTEYRYLAQSTCPLSAFRPVILDWLSALFSVRLLLLSPRTTRTPVSPILLPHPAIADDLPQEVAVFIAHP